MEGVHLSLNFVVKLMQRHPTIVPFLVHISNEAKHMERFAVRARAMTLRAEGGDAAAMLERVHSQLQSAVILHVLALSCARPAARAVQQGQAGREVWVVGCWLSCAVRSCPGRVVCGGCTLRRKSLATKQ